MSAHERSSDRTPLALRIVRTGIPCGLCLSSCITSSDLCKTCLISSRADHAIVTMRHVECSGRRKRHPVQCVALDIRDPHRFLTVSVQCLLRGDSNCAFLRRPFPQDLSWNVLFSVARLLISDFTWFSLRGDPPLLSDPDGLGCRALFSSTLSTLLRHCHQCAHCCLLVSRPGWVLSQFLSSCRSCWCSDQCLWWRWLVHLMLMITRRRLKGVVSSAIFF